MNDKEKLEEIDLIVNIAFQTNEDTLVKEARKRYDALLRIRGIIRKEVEENFDCIECGNPHGADNCEDY